MGEGAYRLIGICTDGRRLTIASNLTADAILSAILDMPLDDAPFCGLQIDPSDPGQAQGAAGPSMPGG